MSIEEREASPFSASFDLDLENARVLIEDHPWKENPQKYRKVAEGIVRRILTFDPRNESAKLLLAKIEAPLPVPNVQKPLILPKTTVVLPGKEAPIMVEAPPPPPAPVSAASVVPAPAADVPAPAADLSFVVPMLDRSRDKPQARRPPRILIMLAVAGVIGGVALLVTHRDTFTTSPYTPKPAATSPAAVQVSTPASAAAPVIPAAPAIPAESNVVPLPPVSPAPSASPSPAPNVEPVSPTASVVVKSSIAPVAPMQTGTLAISSPTTVDIYLGNQLVGSAPTTLVLPAGNQTLEYRHQEMSKVMSHVIKANETTTAMVTFDVVVQINARPWAQVFLDGAQRRALGQTPLSDVLVPIGSVLIFENPNFPGKTYRITGRETQIRVSFP